MFFYSEVAVRKAGCSTGEMYRRMKRVGLISGFIIPGYEVLHTQSREHVTEDVYRCPLYMGGKIGSNNMQVEELFSYTSTDVGDLDRLTHELSITSYCNEAIVNAVVKMIGDR